MGCTSSNPPSVQPSQDTTVQKELCLFAKARLAFEADGSLPKGAPIDLVKFRILLEDPEFISRLGLFSKKIHMYNLLVFWSDILEYKAIADESIELKLSKGFHIYHKYLKADSTVDLGFKFDEHNVKEVYDLLVNVYNIQQHHQMIPSNLMNHFLKACVKEIWISVYKPFQQTDEYISVWAKKSLSNSGFLSVDDFTYFSVLGCGTFGIVVHARKKSTGKHYAVKIQTKLRLLEVYRGIECRVVSEKNALASCRHPFIVSMDYAFQTPTLALMALHLGTAGTLYDCLQMEKVFPMNRVQFYSAEIVLALAHIHRLGMIYRDLKPHNIMLLEDGHIQLVDLGGVIDICNKPNTGPSGSYVLAHGAAAEGENNKGVINNSLNEEVGMQPAFMRAHSKDELRRAFNGKFGKNSVNGCDNDEGRSSSFSSQQGSEHMHRATSVMGTSGYMAPEIVAIEARVNNLVHPGYTSAIDYWSLGATMYHMLLGQVPFVHCQISDFLIYYLNTTTTTQPMSEGVTLQTIAPGNESEQSASDTKFVLDNMIFDAELKLNHPDYVKVMRSMAQSPCLTKSCVDIISCFLHVDEKKRLGSGKSGVKNIKTHSFFNDVDWSSLTHKNISPPFIPKKTVAIEDNCKPQFASLSDMFRHLKLESWLQNELPATLQNFFVAWDFVSASVFKTEMGIALDTETLEAEVEAKSRNSVFASATQFSAYSADAPNSGRHSISVRPDISGQLGRA